MEYGNVDELSFGDQAIVFFGLEEPDSQIDARILGFEATQMAPQNVRRGRGNAGQQQNRTDKHGSDNVHAKTP
jgi:hypothetical protein